MAGPFAFFWRFVRAARRTDPGPRAADAFGRAMRGEPDPRSFGRPEDEADPERCLIKGELLLRSGRSDTAQLFLRQAPRLAPSRRIAAALTLRCASQDFVFQRLIGAADRARDAKKWPEAADLYGQALAAYPEHHGYLVQYAHCLKEQESYAEAECHYRSALALGALPADVDEHLAFVVLRQEEEEAEAEAEVGKNIRRRLRPNETAPQPQSDGADPLFDAAPTKVDVDLLVGLLLGREPKIEETVQLLRQHRTVRSLFVELAEEDAFGAVNLRLLSRHWRDPAER